MVVQYAHIHVCKTHLSRVQYVGDKCCMNHKAALMHKPHKHLKHGTNVIHSNAIGTLCLCNDSYAIIKDRIGCSYIVYVAKYAAALL